MSISPWTSNQATRGRCAMSALWCGKPSPIPGSAGMISRTRPLDTPTENTSRPASYIILTGLQAAACEACAKACRHEDEGRRIVLLPGHAVAGMRGSAAIVFACSIDAVAHFEVLSFRLLFDEFHHRLHCRVIILGGLAR